MTANRLGLCGVILSAAAFLTLNLGARWLPGIGMVAFMVLQLSALVCGAIAAVRGSKWWSLVAAWSVCYLVVLSMSIYSE